MKYRLLLALAALVFHATTNAAEEVTITAPFPKPVIGSKAKILYCNATVGVILNGTDDQGKSTPVGIKPGLTATANMPTDRVVLVIEPDAKTLSLFNRVDYEAGKTDRKTPYAIIDQKTDVIVAFVVPSGFSPPSVGVVTLNRKTGIGTLTDVISNEPFTRNPRIESMYVACSSGKM